MQTKQQLRAHYRALRDAMSPQDVQEKSIAIRKRLLAMPCVERAQAFFIYVSIGNEVGTRDLIETLIGRGKLITVPKITATRIMQTHRLESLADLAPGRYNLPEPSRDNNHDDFVDVCIAPGLAFTPEGHRLGAGGGFYDRYFATRRAKLAIALAYDFQIADHLPVTATDRNVDIIITEKRVIRR
jgi:5-formyltetrahydrofolate cyclo-ligase